MPCWITLQALQMLSTAEKSGAKRPLRRRSISEGKPHPSAPEAGWAAICLFVSGALAQWSGQILTVTVEPDLAMVARWLLAWGDAVVTGMMVAVFVAFRPQWLATWSDSLYVPPPVK